MSTTRRWPRQALIRVAAVSVMGALRVVAEFERRRTRPNGAPLRMFFGMTPNISMESLLKAARLRGIEGATVVREVYSIHQRTSFEHLAEDFLPRVARRWPLALRTVVADLRVFVWALHNFDVFFFYVDGRILVRTPLRRHEFDLLHRAGKKVIVTCYGADVQTLDRIVEPEFRTRLLEDYPSMPQRETFVREVRAEAVRDADVLVGGVEWVDYLDGWTHLISAAYFLDPAEWTASASTHPEGAPIVVFHAANHRRIKGTELLEQAVDRLRSRGVPIELDIVAGVPHTEVRERMARADIVADQFVIGWYGLQAVEAMSLGKPVLCYLRPDLQTLYARHSYAAECPIVPTRPEEIEAILERLLSSVDERQALGRLGRSFVERYHSIEYAGHVLEEWIAAANRAPLPRWGWPPDIRR